MTENNFVCKTRTSALTALDTITGHMAAGIQKSALLAVKSWIEDNTQPEQSREEINALLAKFFEGDEADKLGRQWYNRGSVETGGKLVPTEPDHGARISCLWNAGTKRWEPECIPPIHLEQSRHDSMA
jgi:hypothetical protein